jgi:hypothetical protein
MAGPQNYKNHPRIFPMYHVWTLLPLTLNLLWSLYRLGQGMSGDRIMAVVFAAAVLLGFVAMRVQVLTVQDRVIRLEMRHRLKAVLPPDLYARVPTIPIKQLVALRFASDPELPALVRDVLAGTLSSGKDIKLRVKDWQADYLRA